jgi:hypothetical protein
VAVKFFSRHRTYGEGFRASLLDGLSVDIYDLAGVEYSDSLHDKLWAAQTWRELVERCGAEVIEAKRYERGAPGQSNVQFWVAVGDPDAFRAALREYMLSL